MKFTDREFSRFCFWGAVNTIAGYLFYSCLLLVLPYLASYSIAFVVSIFVSYFFNSRFVFRANLELVKAAKYPLVYVNQYLLGAVCLYVAVHFLHVNTLVAPLLVVVLTIPATYFLSRKIVHGRPRILGP